MTNPNHPARTDFVRASDSPSRPAPHSSDLVRLGIDIGSVNVKVVLQTPAGHHALTRPAKGRPLSTLLSMLEALELQEQQLVAVTGGGHMLISEPLDLYHVTEVVAAACSAADNQSAGEPIRTVIDLGGQLSRWILLAGPSDHEEPGTVIDFATNGLCAAGSGAFLEQQAARLQLPVDALGKHAADAARGATIAGRCSVFAKSDMIHLQQKGTPVDEMAYGLCQALVRTFLSTVAAGRDLEGPVLLAGGGAKNPGIQRAFVELSRLSDDDFVVADAPEQLAAQGAAKLARSRVDRDDFIDELRKLERSQSASKTPSDEPAQKTRLVPLEKTMPPTPAAADERRTNDQAAPAQDRDETRVYLGVDVGSISTNLVLLSADDEEPTEKPCYEVLAGVYLPTRGRPVDALDEGLRELAAQSERDQTRWQVVGVGTTGSGRHLAARALGGDIVRNEITAQMVSATHVVPDVDTIFEIGGQDSKYISVRDGALSDFEMNKICAAGTGSFLEEQAERLGVSIFGEFAEQARQAKTPRDLGTRCTVFMDSELVRQQENGAPVSDLCAGLAYSVARNYLEKVVASRPVGKSVVFQGGTASNAAVVAAFRALLDRPVHVHPQNRISGAIGAGLLAARARREHHYQTQFRGFDACGSAEVKSFECKRCDNRCQVNRVSFGERAVHFGDACERFSERDQQVDNSPRPFAELFAQRQQLWREAVDASRPLGGESDRPPLGLLSGSVNLEQQPFWAAFVRQLGYRPVFAPPTSARLLKEYDSIVPPEICLPIKAAAAQFRALLDKGRSGQDGVEQVFIPSVMEHRKHKEDSEAHACLYHQQLPDMLRARHGEQLITAQFSLAEGMLGLASPTVALATALGRKKSEVLEALVVAKRAQKRFDAARHALGQKALRSDFERAVVVLGKPYNTHDPVLNLDVARLLDRAGLLAIPWDLLPLADEVLEERWKTVPWHYNREQLRALKLIRRDARLYPLLISSYGCGPDGFIVKHLEDLLSGTPHLLLEFDEHRGEAGLVTRIEAFIDEIETHRRKKRRRRSTRDVTPARPPIATGRRCLIPNFSEHAYVFSGVLRSAGFRAEVLPRPDSETVRRGEAHASGRECHPYSVIAGELTRLAERPDVGKDDVFFQVSCVTPCLLRQYGDSYRILSERLGLPVDIWDGASPDMQQLFGTKNVVRVYEGLLAVDILSTLAVRLRPNLEEPDRADELLQKGVADLERALEKKKRLPPVLARHCQLLLDLPRHSEPGSRPVVGVTGDFYTRINPIGNSDLFSRLEKLGCEVWPNPGFALMTEMSLHVNGTTFIREGRLARAAHEGFGWAVTSGVRAMLHRQLSPQVHRLAVESSADRLLILAGRHLGPQTNYLISLGVAKVIDFLERGAVGTLNVAGINCMVGTSIDATLPALRKTHPGAPIMTLLYGNSEGPAMRTKLETFIHQVQQRHERLQRASA